MKRRRTDKPARREARPAPFHAPFGDLRKRIKAQVRDDPPTPPGTVVPSSKSRAPAPSTTRGAGRSAPRGVGPPTTRPTPGPAAEIVDRLEDDATSFLRAMADVRRLDADARIDAPAPAMGVPMRAGIDEDAEALGVLADLVAGAAGFDISDSTEYVEGAVVGLDPRILRRVRHGEFPYRATLDLHGMTASAARSAVEAFVTRAFRSGERCVLIVHGRGRNSPDQVPVLKERLKSWLSHGKVGRAVLAFTSARPADGGTGALYVLLRRRHGAKEPIQVLEGAKRE